ncbi:hypothetical protein GF362_04925 [Candidatus Dojkabacteria bacterium]|nr:hypothetical protein [Candidatus Dojkabacteria bacterium]
MEIKEKVKNFIKYCGCISEIDKYFWLSKIDEFSEDTLTQIYSILLKYERELVNFELTSINKIQQLILKTYPELQDKFLPNYKELFEDFKTIEKEITFEQIKDIRNKISTSLKNIQP